MNLEAYAGLLTEGFDKHMNLLREHGREMDQGYAAAYRLALAHLDTFTGGQFGTPMADLPSPWTIEPPVPATQR